MAIKFGARAPEDECPNSEFGHFATLSRFNGWVCKNCGATVKPYEGPIPDAMA